MANWTRDEHLTFDIAFALKKVTLPGFRKALKEEDRIAIAATILEHLKLCRWVFKATRTAALKRPSACPPVTRAQASPPDVSLEMLASASY
jgi:hypothetical protein